MEQGTQEWLEMRKSHIGASDAPVIMGVCKFKLNDGRLKTPRLLWEEKLGLLKTESNNYATRYGTRMEEPARKEYQEMVNDLFEPAIVFHPEIKYMMASLDGINLTQDRAVEIKNANATDHEVARNGKVPKHYYPQVQHQLEILFQLYNITQIDYFSYHKGEGIIVPVDRNEKYVKEMIDSEAKFIKCVNELEEPDIIDGDFVERDTQWVTIAREFWLCKQTKRDLEVEEKALEKKLKDLSEGVSSRAEGYRYAVGTVRGSVDYKAIPELANVDFDQYRKPCSMRWSLQKET